MCRRHGAIIHHILVDCGSKLLPSGEPPGLNNVRVCASLRTDLTLSVYNDKPKRFLERLFFDEAGNPTQKICCAGFELEAWRCVPFASHLVEWLPEYALPEEELNVNELEFARPLRARRLG